MIGLRAALKLMCRAMQGGGRHGEDRLWRGKQRLWEGGYGYGYGDYPGVEYPNPASTAAFAVFWLPLQALRPTGPSSPPSGAEGVLASCPLLSRKNWRYIGVKLSFDKSKIVVAKYERRKFRGWVPKTFQICSKLGCLWQIHFIENRPSQWNTKWPSGCAYPCIQTSWCCLQTALVQVHKHTIGGPNWCNTTPRGSPYDDPSLAQGNPAVVGGHPKIAIFQPMLA